MLQLFVRLDESDENGNGYCCSCGKQVSRHNCDGGHYQPKGNGYNLAAFIRKNVHIQCKGCNGFRQGNPAGYAMYMLMRYTDNTIQRIAMASYKKSNHYIHEKVYLKYKVKCEELVKTKNYKVKIG